MVSGIIVLLQFSLCGTEVCGGPNVVTKTFPNVIACHKEIEARLAKDENRRDLYACALGRYWIPDTPPKPTTNICKPHSKEKDCHKP